MPLNRPAVATLRVASLVTPTDATASAETVASVIKVFFIKMISVIQTPRKVRSARIANPSWIEV